MTGTPEQLTKESLSEESSLSHKSVDFCIKLNEIVISLTLHTTTKLKPLKYFSTLHCLLPVSPVCWKYYFKKLAKNEYSFTHMNM